MIKNIFSFVSKKGFVTVAAALLVTGFAFGEPCHAAQGDVQAQKVVEADLQAREALKADLQAQEAGEADLQAQEALEADTELQPMFVDDDSAVRPEIAVFTEDKIIRNENYTFVFTGTDKVEIKDFNLAGYSKEADGVEASKSNKKITVRIPANVTYLTKEGELKECTVDGIGETAFAGCKGVKSFEFPETCRYIKSGAFAVSDIESVELPDAMVSIYDSAFYGCSKLKKVILPLKLKKLGSGAFSYCSALKKVKLPSKNNYYKLADGIIYTKDMKKVVCAVLPASEVKLKDTVTAVSAYAFEGKTGIESVVFPASLKKIGEGAFYDCTGIKELFIPKSVKNIAKSAFSGCRSLKLVKFETGKTKLDNNTVYDKNTMPGKNDRIFANTSYYLEICIPSKYKESMSSIIKQHSPKGVIITVR